MSRKETTRQEILQAAQIIILEKGYEAVTVRELAKITGYSYTSLYYYFRDLNELLWVLRLNMIEEMIGELANRNFKDLDPVIGLRQSFIVYTDYFFDNPNIFRFFYFARFKQPEGDKGYQEIEQKFNDIWQDSFALIVKEGYIQPGDIEIVAKTIIYALQGMIALSLSSNGSINREEVKKDLERLINYLLQK